MHQSVAAEFTAALRAEITNFYGAVAEKSADYARIVNDHHAERLRGLLDDAVTKGAKVVHGGKGEGRFLEPTLIEAMTPEMEIDREEIFGPILPIMTFDDLEEPIARINERPKPLAALRLRTRQGIHRAGDFGHQFGRCQRQWHRSCTTPTRACPSAASTIPAWVPPTAIHGFQAFSHEQNRS